MTTERMKKRPLNNINNSSSDHNHPLRISVMNTNRMNKRLLAFLLMVTTIISCLIAILLSLLSLSTSTLLSMMDIKINLPSSNYGTGMETTMTMATMTTSEMNASSLFVLSERYQNPTILRDGCAATVLFVDPYLSEDALWALESVVANIHPLEKTCFLLQTSICMFKMEMDDKDDSTQQQQRQQQQYHAKVMHVMNVAQPKFRSMIERGNVRMTVLDHRKYHLRSCTNYYNPSFLYENYQYWGPDEFDPADSDLILMMQADAVLCHDLNLDKWRDVAWVGAPWAASKGKKGWHYCSAFPRQWKSFHDVGRNSTSTTAASSYSPPLPDYPNEDEMCSDTRYGPQGNGGLSIRSRSWLQKAIAYCPTHRFEVSGLSREVFDASICRATDTDAEDSYFVTILRGIGAPLPSNYEAALFAQELRSTRDVANQFNLAGNVSFMEDMVRKRWYSPNDPTGLTLFRDMKKHQPKLDSENNNVDAVVSIGLHKPWNQALVQRINEDHLNEYCPYLRKIVARSHYVKNKNIELKFH